ARGAIRPARLQGHEGLADQYEVHRRHGPAQGRASPAGRDAARRGGRGAGGRSAGVPGEGPGARGPAEVRGRPPAGAGPGLGTALRRRADAGGHPPGGGRVRARRAGRHTPTQAPLQPPVLPPIPNPRRDSGGPSGVPREPVEAQATITLSASPDSGWPTLKAFLAGTAETLTVGPDDFTSAHVAQAVTDSLAGKKLSLVLDHPAKNPTADQTDPTTVSQLRQAVAGGFTQAWALTRTDPDATAWIFPSAYHIKVAVRDRAAFWLSSGNWNNSNQPDIHPVTVPADAQKARHGDRDWHVVTEHPQLAGVFEDYIRNDLQIASGHNTPPEAAGKPLAPPSLGSSQTPPFSQFFPAATVTGTIKITPLLTPDPGVYTGAISELIASATQTLYMQFQYIEPPKAGDPTAQPFSDLINAVIDRQAHGVDVKIIMRDVEKVG